MLILLVHGSHFKTKMKWRICLDVQFPNLCACLYLFISRALGFSFQIGNW